MLNLPRNSFNKIKNLLLRQQKMVEDDLKALKEEDPVLTPTIAESSEPGTDSWLADVHTRALAARQNLQNILMKTRHALSLIRSGSYGKCEVCGKKIEAARLEAMPTATTCLSCSKKKSR